MIAQPARFVMKLRKLLQFQRCSVGLAEPDCGDVGELFEKIVRDQ